MGSIFFSFLSAMGSIENATSLCLLELSTWSHNAITNDAVSVALP